LVLRHVVRAAAFALTIGAAAEVRAQQVEKHETRAVLPVEMPKKVEDPKGDEHNEAAGAPIVGGNTDIGFQMGLAGTLARVGPRWQPYRWKIDGLVSASVKGGPRGTEVVQQSHDIRIDVPRALSGRLRIMPAVFFERTVNAGYFGIGNAAPAVANSEGVFGNRYQYVHQEVRARVNLRSALEGPYSIMYGLTLRHVAPEAYPGSKLDLDSRLLERGGDPLTARDGDPLIRGLNPLGHGILSGGLIYDTRDNEITPNKGAFDQYAMRAGVAIPTREDVRYLGVNWILRRYVPLGRSFVLAGRAFADLLFGNVAFYDLSQGGAFTPLDMPGGAQGIRGVPNGRYQGLVKLVGNVELRVTHLHFRLFGDDFKIGNNVFFDTGRVFASYSADDRDGKGVGLKYGVGGGMFVVWGTAAVFRIEIAYSPDASAANPGFPFGIYAADGQMF
jgi:hypothetical protein